MAIIAVNIFWLFLSLILSLVSLFALLVVYAQYPPFSWMVSAFLPFLQGPWDLAEVLVRCVFQNAAPALFVRGSLLLLPWLLSALTLLSWVAFGRAWRILQQAEELVTRRIIVLVPMLIAFFFSLWGIAILPEIDRWGQLARQATPVASCEAAGFPSGRVMGDTVSALVTQGAPLLVLGLVPFLVVSLLAFGPRRMNRALALSSCAFCGLHLTDHDETQKGCVLCHEALQVTVRERADQQITLHFQHVYGLPIAQPTLELSGFPPLAALQGPHRHQWQIQHRQKTVTAVSDLLPDPEGHEVTLIFQNKINPRKAKLRVRPATSRLGSQWRALGEATP